MPNPSETRPSWRNPLTLAAGALFLVHILLKYAQTLRGGSWPENSGIDAVALGLAVIALVPWIADFLSSAKLPGGIEFAFRGVQRRQILTEQAIAQLRFIVEGFLTRDEYRHLENIQRNIEYEVKPEAAAALAGELRRLRALGLIEGGGIGDFAKADGRKRRIGDKFHLTPRGEEYLVMRRQNQVLDATGEDEGSP